MALRPLGGSQLQPLVIPAPYPPSSKYHQTVIKKQGPGFGAGAAADDTQILSSEFNRAQETRFYLTN
jgi:hypothetical protein